LVNDCCIFPTTAKPKLNFTTGERRFGAGRSGGRLHAASDLYRNLNDPIRAIQDGVVIQGLRYFYDGTYSLVVRHKGGFIVRYGEVAGRAAPNIREGARVKKGQVIGYVGSTGKSTGPHLHYEVIYNGKKINSQTLKLPSGKILKGKTRQNFEVTRIKLDVLKSEIISSLN